MTDDTASWLTSLNLATLIPIFEQQQIDMDVARDLTEDDLRELSLLMGPRKKLLRAIALLQPDTDITVDLMSAADTAALEKVTIPADGPMATSEGESRQVTVLFADISGFTNLSAQIGAEDTHTLLEAYFEKADKIVQLHGGYVDKHIGDSVMAVFGVPVAYGNEAERALDAALAIHGAMPAISEKVGRALTIHIGLASGQVVASSVGSDKRFTVIGESVNLAARLTDKAKSGETIISENIRNALPVGVDLGDGQQLELKGFKDPITGYIFHESEDPRSTMIEHTPIIGRTKELAQFRVAMDDCLQSSRGQFVCLRGEAGIGKTRLSREFLSMAVASGFVTHKVLVIDFGAAMGQDALRSIIRSMLGLEVCSNDADGFPDKSAVLETGLISEEELPHLNSLLGLSQPDNLRSIYDAMTPEHRKRGQRELIANLVKRAAAKQPLMILIEDIHWADKQTLEGLAETVRQIGGVSAMLVATTRFEGDPYQTLYRTGLGSTATTIMDVRSLRPDEASQLASKFSGADEKLVQLCIERAAGNPLFLEQLLRNAATLGLQAVPDTVQSLVQASLDNLGRADRGALEAATVIGQRFNIDHVRQVTELHDYDPSEIVARQLVQTEGGSFLFVHSLVREGIYASMLKSRCRKLHAKAASIVGDKDPGLRARHLELSEDSDAAKAYLDAAKFAAHTYEEEAVVKFCDRGLRLVSDATVLLELTRMRANALRHLGQTEASIDEFRNAFDASVTEEDKCHALIGIAEGMRVVGKNEDALDVLNDAESASAAMSTLTRARIFYLRGSVSFPLGNIKQCLASHNTSLELAREAGDAEAEASALSGLGDAYYLQGLMNDSCKRFAECMEISREHDLGRIEVANRSMVGWSRIHLMEFNEAREDGIACARMAEQVGNPRAEMLGKLLIGYTSMKLGDMEQATISTLDALKVADGISAEVFSINILATLAEIYRDTEEPTLARETIAEGRARLAKAGNSFIGPYAYAVAASLEEDEQKAAKFVKDSEDIFEQGCVSHNYAWFSDVVINMELAKSNWDAVARHADRLEAFTKKQPLAWSDFIVDRARTLSEIGQGSTDKVVILRAKALESAASKAGLVTRSSSMELDIKPTILAEISQ